jgi:hypothetical protein
MYTCSYYFLGQIINVLSVNMYVCVCSMDVFRNKILSIYLTIYLSISVFQAALSHLPARYGYRIQQNQTRCEVSFATRSGPEDPFLDVCLYTYNQTHMWDTNPVFEMQKYPFDVLFPLVSRPFFQSSLPTINN